MQYTHISGKVLSPEKKQQQQQKLIQSERESQDSKYAENWKREPTNETKNSDIISNQKTPLNKPPPYHTATEKKKKIEEEDEENNEGISQVEEENGKKQNDIEITKKHKTRAPRS